MKIIKRITLLLILIIIILVSVYTALGYNMYKSALEETSLEDKVLSIREQKNFTTFNELPQIYIDAVISVEDHRFYYHSGVDLIGVLRAILNDIKSRELIEGGSTITQQLAKNTYFTQNRSLVRKIAETFMALKIEQEYEKNEIFELYVNTSYFGDGYYSIGDASRGYFNKAPIDMTDYESTLLAGVPNAPSIYAPTNNLKLAEERQKQVISTMIENGILSEEKAQNIIQKKQD